MLKLSDWVLLKGLFKPRLSNAILEKDEARIRKIINDEYREEKEEGFFSDEPLDMERLYEEHMKEINDEDLIRKFL